MGKDRYTAPLLIDRRTGSKELYGPLLQLGVLCELTTLEFGDALIFGNGPTQTVLVGIERKGIRDLLSSLLSGRLVGHQLPGLVEFSYSWLVVEGIWRTTYDDEIEIAHGGKWIVHPGIRGSQLTGWLTTLQMKSQIRLWRTGTIDETAHFLGSLHRWWTTKPWQEHRAHLGIYQMGVDSALFSRPSLVRRVAAELPGIGLERSRAVEQQFETVLAMAVAPAQEWQTIAGVGKTTAARVVRALQERE